MPLFRVADERVVESRFGATRGASLSQFVGLKSELGILLDRCAQEHKRGRARLNGT